MKTLYYILEAAITYLALIGTWEIARATVARGTISNVQMNSEAEQQYKPLSALNPLCLFKMLRWWFEWKSEERGIADSVILKKRFSWGLRYLILSIILIYILQRLKFIFFSL
jgi:hypothetical protein